jgi:myxalamid-type polyketide synthase MxaB
VAQALGAEVFATASPGKWEALRAQGVRHIANSRNLDFRDEVMRATNGLGVDVVLNSLNGEFIPASLSTLRPGGRFVEIGLLGIWDSQRVAAEYPHVSYFTLDIDREENVHPGTTRAVMERLAARFAAGELKPLPHRVFPVHRIVDALRHLNHARRVGKVVVAVRPEGPAQRAGKTEIRDDATYLITGGLGGLGLEVARWLAEQGARHMVLVGRSGAATPDQTAAVQRLREGGAEVRVVPADVSRQEDVERLLATIRSDMPPLCGVFHAAGTLDDGMLRLQTWDRFERVMRPKVAGAWRLHELAGDLDLFVLFSSGVGLVGSHGQGNYAAANAFLDALAQHRRALGLPAASIAWGPWTDVGMMARLDDRARARMAQIGLRTIDPHDGRRMLGAAIGGGWAHVAPMRVDWPRLAAAIPPAPLWSELARAPDAAEQGPSVLLAQLRAATAGERTEMLVAHLRSEVASVLGWGSTSQVGRRQKLFDLGMDSLTSVELHHRLEQRLACSLPLTVVFDYPTIEALAQYLAGQLAFAGEESAPRGPEAAGGDADVARLHAMSDEEVESRLADRLKGLLDE